MARALKRLQIRRAALFVTLFALLLSTFTFVNQSPARAATVGSGACAQSVSSATGVSVTQIGNDCVVTFTSGSNTWTAPSLVNNVRLLAVGGGGAGGGGIGGGGGAGEFVEYTAATPKAAASAKPTAKAASTAKPTSSASPAATPEPTPKDLFANAPKPNAGIDTPNQGDANAIVGDESVETVVTVTEFAKQIEIGDSISISFQATDAAGNQIPTSPNGSVQVVQGASINATGSGFKPDSPVEAWLYSTPVLLGSGLAKADGSFDNTYAIDSDFPLGDHTVVLHGISPTDEVITLALGVTVIADEAESSSNTLLLAVLAFLGALLTAGLWLVLRRRSGTHK